MRNKRLCIWTQTLWWSAFSTILLSAHKYFRSFLGKINFYDAYFYLTILRPQILWLWHGPSSSESNTPPPRGSGSACNCLIQAVSLSANTTECGVAKLKMEIVKIAKMNNEVTLPKWITSTKFTGNPRFYFPVICCSNCHYYLIEIGSSESIRHKEFQHRSELQSGN